MSAAVAVCLRGGSARGVCPGGGVCVHLPLWTEFLTHACENITFPQLRFRTVMKHALNFIICSSLSSNIKVDIKMSIYLEI